jgi:hypothetical protein
VEERYDYRLIRVERGAWRKVAEAVHGECAETVNRAGGAVFGFWRGEIGFHNDEGVVITAWPPRTEPDHAATDGLPSVIDATIERLVATARPTAPEPPLDDGVYAHRWFETTEEHWPEFVELSVAAWPDFEGSFPGTRIVGLWRSLDTKPPAVRALLITRYPTLAVWERSRPFEGEQAPGMDRARGAFLRRAELTERTIVRITRLVVPRG